MRKGFLPIALLCAAVFIGRIAGAQTVYFHRFVASTDGRISYVPTSGPEASLLDLLTGLGVPDFGGLVYNPEASVFYAADPSSSRILEIDLTGASQVVASSIAGIANPGALAFDAPNKHLYVANRGTQNILRIDISGTFPVGFAQITTFVSDPTPYTGNISDMKFNGVDGALYWSHNRNLYRVPRTFDRMSETPALVQPSVATEIRFFDLDVETPQNIYFVDQNASNAGIYKGVLPAGTGNATITTDVRILNTSMDATDQPAGIALDPFAGVFCYSTILVNRAAVRCADRSTPSISTTVIQDPGTGATMATPPAAQLVIISAPTSTPTPVPTATPVFTATPTSTPGPLTPDIKPVPPEVTVDVENRQITLVLQDFDGVSLRASIRAMLARLARKLGAAASGRLGFRYKIEIRRTTDSNGNALPGRRSELQRKFSKRNELTVKNLSQGSGYSVKYRVQITRRTAGGPTQVVGRTAFSAPTQFSVR